MKKRDVTLIYGVLSIKNNIIFICQNGIRSVFTFENKVKVALFCNNKDYKFILNVLKHLNPKCILRQNIFYSIKYNKNIIKNIDNFFPKEFQKFFENFWNLDHDETCYKLLFSLHKFFLQHLNYDILKNSILSLTSLAFYIYRTFFSKNMDIIYFIHEIRYKKLQKAFIGGRCDIFIHTLYKSRTTHHFDINSFYPFIMRNCEMPMGKAKFYILGSSGLNKMEEETLTRTFFGFAKIKFYIKEIETPILPIKQNSKLVFGLGEGTGIFFSEEIRLAEEHGYSITYLEVYSYTKKIIFQQFVDFFYPLKNISIFNKKFIKTFLNRTYGSFSINKDFPLEKINLMPNYIDKQNFHNLEIDEELNCIIIKENIKTKNYRNIGISAAISSYGRVFLYNLIEKYKKDLIYCDTDSLFLTCYLDSNNHKLGWLKKENQFDIIDFCFISAKFYALKFSNDSEKLVIKGFLETDLYWSFCEIKNKFISAIKKNSNYIILKHKQQGEIKFYINDKRLILDKEEGIFTNARNF